jgi:hypothetical protein
MAQQLAFEGGRGLILVASSGASGRAPDSGDVVEAGDAVRPRFWPNEACGGRLPSDSGLAAASSPCRNRIEATLAEIDELRPEGRSLSELRCAFLSDSDRCLEAGKWDR